MMKIARIKLFTIFCSAMVIMVVSGGCSITIEHFPGFTTTSGQALTPTATFSPVNTTWSIPSQTPGVDFTNWADAVEKIRPSVVSVETSTGSGSGWIIDSEGLIITNEHVVAGASDVGVVLSDGQYFDVIEIYADEITDIAVLVVETSDLPVATIGKSSQLRVGAPVAAVGNALGLGISMKGGWVSQLNVSTVISGKALYGLIETDAAMNPGNSGGPLINLAGEVVGITNAKLVDITIEGVGYAISIDSILPVIERLITQGSITYPVLGIWGMLTVNPSLDNYYDLGIDYGVLIQGVTAGTGAEAAGLQAYDVILSVDGTSTLTVEELVWFIRSKDVGQTIEISYYRSGQEYKAMVTLS
jgi:serine protease Do